MATKKNKLIVKSRLSDVSTNRNKKTRKLLSWTLPATGTLDAFLDKRLAELGDGGERVQYSLPGLMTDRAEMLEDVDGDLQRFKEQEIAITRRHMDLLELIGDRLTALGANKRLVGGSTEAVSEDVRVAMLGVHAARGALAYRWAANGLPLDQIDLRRASGSPRTLFAAGSEALIAARAHLDAGSFDSPGYAKRLIDAFAAALKDLESVAGLKVNVGVSRGIVNAQRRVLLRCLYEYCLWLSRWGRAMAGDDPDAQRRWRLDKTFPNQPKLAKAATDEQLVKAATKDPVESDDFQG
jgi:hypothetical protein